MPSASCSSPAQPTTPKGRPSDELLAAALRIVDSQGLAALTMRRLADALGVEAMSLYHHLPNKGALLEWTVERLRSETRLPDPLPKDWVDLMEAIFGEYGRVLAERSHEWRDETCRRELRMIMEGYRPCRHSDRGDRATDSGRRS